MLSQNERAVKSPPDIDSPAPFAYPDPMIRSWRRATAYTGLVLLAFSLIAGALLPARASSTDEPAYICTALGLKAIGPDDSQPAETGQSAGLCAACLPLMQGGIDTPPETFAAGVTFVVASIDVLAPLGLTVAAQPHHSPQSLRGPPAV